MRPPFERATPLTKLSCESTSSGPSRRSPSFPRQRRLLQRVYRSVSIDQTAFPDDHLAPVSILVHAEKMRANQPRDDVCCRPGVTSSFILCHRMQWAAYMSLLLGALHGALWT